MIEFGPIDGTAQSSAAPEEMPVAIVIERAARELDRISFLVRELEENLLNARQTGSGVDTIVAQQSVDVVQQSVDVLAGFLKDFAGQCGSWDALVGPSLSLVTLGAMRERMIRGSEVEFS